MACLHPVGTLRADKSLPSTSAQNDEIERTSSERFTLYRRCKLEEIELPLTKGRLEDIPMEEVRLRVTIGGKPRADLTSE